MKKFFIAFAVVFVLAIGGFYALKQSAIPGFWTLNAGESALNFGSIKNGFIGEVHAIPGLSGGADFNGEFSVSLDLASVDTGVDIRNERMRDLFFETGTYPVAVITGAFDPKMFEHMEVGGRVTLTLPVTIALHGVEQSREVEVSVVRLAWGKILVASERPVMIEAAEFNLDDGLERLRAAVGLDSIAAASPVTFTLVFDGSAKP